MMLSKDKKANAIAKKMMKRNAADSDGKSSSNSSTIADEGSHTSSSSLAMDQTPQLSKDGLKLDTTNDKTQAQAPDTIIEDTSVIAGKNSSSLSDVGEKEQSELASQVSRDGVKSDTQDDKSQVKALDTIIQGAQAKTDKDYSSLSGAGEKVPSELAPQISEDGVDVDVHDECTSAKTADTADTTTEHDMSTTTEDSSDRSDDVAEESTKQTKDSETSIVGKDEGRSEYPKHFQNESIFFDKGGLAVLEQQKKERTRLEHEEEQTRIRMKQMAKPKDEHLIAPPASPPNGKRRKPRNKANKSKENKNVQKPNQRQWVPKTEAGKRLLMQSKLKIESEPISPEKYEGRYIWELTGKAKESEVEATLGPNWKDEVGEEFDTETETPTGLKVQKLLQGPAASEGSASTRVLIETPTLTGDSRSGEDSPSPSGNTASDSDSSDGASTPTSTKDGSSSVEDNTISTIDEPVTTSIQDQQVICDKDDGAQPAPDVSQDTNVASLPVDNLPQDLIEEQKETSDDSLRSSVHNAAIKLESMECDDTSTTSIDPQITSADDDTQRTSDDLAAGAIIGEGSEPDQVPQSSVHDITTNDDIIATGLVEIEAHIEQAITAADSTSFHTISEDSKLDQEAIVLTPTAPSGLLKLANSDVRSHFPTRDFEDAMVAMHVRQLVFVSTLNKNENEAAKKDKSTCTPVDESVSSEPEMVVSDDDTQTMVQTEEPIAQPESTIVNDEPKMANSEQDRDLQAQESESALLQSGSALVDDETGIAGNEQDTQTTLQTQEPEQELLQVELVIAEDEPRMADTDQHAPTQEPEQELSQPDSTTLDDKFEMASNDQDAQAQEPDLELLQLDPIIADKEPEVASSKQNAQYAVQMQEPELDLPQPEPAIADDEPVTTSSEQETDVQEAELELLQPDSTKVNDEQDMPAPTQDSELDLAQPESPLVDGDSEVTSSEQDAQNQESESESSHPESIIVDDEPDEPNESDDAASSSASTDNESDEATGKSQNSDQLEEPKISLPTFPGAVMDFSHAHEEFQASQEERFRKYTSGMAKSNDNQFKAEEQNENQSMAYDDSISDGDSSSAVSCSIDMSPFPRHPGPMNDDVKTTQKLWELRNTFLVGSIVSLEEFVEALPFDASGIVSKRDVKDTFSHFAQYECEQLQQEKIHIFPHNTGDRSRSPYLTKLGKISLYKFLNEIPFDAQESTSVVWVGKAFRELAKPSDIYSLDKARVFLDLEAAFEG